jgi:hypothetical protein
MFFLQHNYVEKETVLYHSIEVSLKISINKLQERIQSDCYQITRPYSTAKHHFQIH